MSWALSWADRPLFAGIISRSAGQHKLYAYTQLPAIQGIQHRTVWTLDSVVFLASVVCVGVQSLDSSVVCLTSAHLQVCKDNGNQGAATCSSVLPPISN